MSHAPNHPRPRLRVRTALMLPLLAVMTAVHATAFRMRRRVLADEAGNVITDNLAWIVFGVIAIVAIGGLIETLGSQVMSWVTGQLGI